MIGGVQDLVVEDGEVEGKTKTDWVCWCKISLGDLSGVLVSLEGLVGRLLSLVANGKLSKVSVVIALPDERSVLHTVRAYAKKRLTSCGRKPWTLRS